MMNDRRDIKDLQNELNRKEIMLQSAVSENKRYANEAEEILESFTEEDAKALESVGLSVSLLKSLDLDRLAKDDAYHQTFVTMCSQMKETIKTFIDKGLAESESKF